MKLLANTSLSNGNPTLPIRWCLDPKDVKVLKDNHAQDTHILIVVSYENGQEDRQLLPLDQTMTYVSFRYPGKHKVYAKLFWLLPEDGSPGRERTAKLRKCFLEKCNRNRYERNVLENFNHEAFGHEPLEIRNGFSILWANFSPSPKASLDVEVQPGYFAKEPPAWLGWWANLWWKYGPTDQCELRKRKILAFTVQPLAVLAWVIGRAVIGLVFLVIGLLFGLRNMHIMPLFHPFRESLESINGEVEDAGGHEHHFCSVFCHNSKHNLRSRLWLPFTPPAILAYLFILSTISRGLKMPFLKFLALISKWAWAHILLVISSFPFWAAVGILAACTLGAILATSFGTPRWLESYGMWRKERERWAELAEKNKKRMLEELRLVKLDDLYKEMQCSTIPWSPSIKALPKKRQTLTLRFYDLKSKVCKPFAG